MGIRLDSLKPSARVRQVGCYGSMREGHLTGGIKCVCCGGCFNVVAPELSSVDETKKCGIDRSSEKCLLRGLGRGRGESREDPCIRPS